MIERWFCSFKYEEAYLTEWLNIREARAAIKVHIHTYNFERCHSAIGSLLKFRKFVLTTEPL